MTNSTMFKHDNTYTKAYDLSYGGNHRDEEPVDKPIKSSRRQRIKDQINFNINKFTNHRYVGNGIRAVTKRKFKTEV